MKARDAFEVYGALKARWPGASRNLLYACWPQEGGDWREIARERRTEILLRLDAMGLTPLTPRIPMRRADRLFQIVQLVRGRRLTTADYLARRLEVSMRTVYRDIAALIGQGVPIEGEAGVGYCMRAWASTCRR